MSAGRGSVAQPKWEGLRGVGKENGEGVASAKHLKAGGAAVGVFATSVEGEKVGNKIESLKNLKAALFSAKIGKTKARVGEVAAGRRDSSRRRGTSAKRKRNYYEESERAFYSPSSSS